MTNTDDVMKSDDVNKNLVRPTFLSLKRGQFYPTLPATPEHGSPFNEGMGLGECDWDILTSSALNVTKKPAYYDDMYDVFSVSSQTLERKEKKKEVVTGTSFLRTLSCEGKKKGKDKTQKGPDETQCCSQWLRAYLRKLWVKAPPEPPTDCRPRQLTILERDFMRKPRSPRGLRRVSRKRHNATSQFIYSAFFEDTVRELKEERHDDVIYAITVKKDTLSRNYSSKSLSEADLLREKGTTKHLKGATLDHMVGRLSRVFVGENEDVNFLNVFLTTYRTFSTPEELLAKMTEEYKKLKTESSTKNAAILRSIVRVLRAWLERYAQDDFYNASDDILLRKLLDLARIHDDVMNQRLDDVTKNLEKSPRIRSVSPTSPRKNGVVLGAGFADYVAAKLAVAQKLNKEDSEKPFSSPLASPTHSQNLKLDLLAEAPTLNKEPARQLLFALSSRYLAAQLTVIAAKLFHRVQPHHCLAAICSKTRPATVRATIDQFNRVVYCVMATSLCPSLKPPQRTKILTKWIEVAQECRELKNFSSLRAIVSGLQTHALHQLKRAWSGVPHPHMNLLKELAEINMKDLIMKVGTAKVNTEDSSITRVRKDAALRRHQDMHLGIMHGTVPYLGSFLTDLTYLDTARPDFLENGLINFEKRRKEFELLAQLQLWQASCRSYQNLEPDELFMEWFQSVTVLTEAQAIQISEMIEPRGPTITSPAMVSSPLKRAFGEMIIPVLGDGECVQNSMSLKHNHKPENGVGPNKLSQSFNGRITPSPGAQNKRVKLRLIRNRAKLAESDVTDRKDKSAKDDVTRPENLNFSCEYKTISISSNERTAAVLKKSLEAYMIDVESNLKRFSLVQVLHDSHKEIQIPESANVFYAMNSADQEPTLVLLEEGAEIPNKAKRHQSTPHKHKKHRHRKNHSVSYIRNRDSSPSRSSSRGSASPMKSFYRQIALGSVALVGGSYSPSEAARRSSDSEESPHPSIAAGDSGVVLLNSRASVDDESDADDAGEPWRRRIRQMRASMSDASLLKKSENVDTASRLPERCYSADFSSSAVILPVRVVKASTAVSSQNLSSKSAPCSPQFDKRSDVESGVTSSVPSTPDRDIITATGKLVEWPRYTTFNTARSATWSSRRALRKNKKQHSASTFYVDKSRQMVGNLEDSKEHEPGASRSKFYVDMSPKDDAVTTTKQEKHPRPQTIRLHSSHTLPPRLSPDFTGFNDEVQDMSLSALSLQPKTARSETTLAAWKPDHKAPKKLNSSNSLSSNISNHSEIVHSDEGSCISFTAASEDNVFEEELMTSPDIINYVTDSSSENSEKLTPPPPPQIKIQCASPDTFLNSPDFSEDFGSNPAQGVQEQNSLPGESDQEDNTYL